MPFPFDNVQTIGILSSRTSRHGGRGRLPFIPVQDKQDPPPPPPPPPPGGNDRIYPNPLPVGLGVSPDITIYVPFTGGPAGTGSDVGMNDPFDDIHRRINMYWYDKLNPPRDPNDFGPPTTPIVKSYKDVQLPEDVALRAKYLVYTHHFFKDLNGNPVDPNTAERLANVLVDIGKMFDSREIRDFLENLKTICPEMEEFIGRLLNKPWRDVFFQVREGTPDIPPKVELENGVIYLYGKDLQGNDVKWPTSIGAGSTERRPDSDPNISDPNNPVIIDYDRSDVTSVTINLPIIDATALQTGCDKDILLMKYMIHEMVHREGGSEIEAYWLANELLKLQFGAALDSNCLTPLTKGTRYWDEFQKVDDEINSRNKTIGDPNNLFGKWMNVDANGNVICNDLAVP